MTKDELRAALDASGVDYPADATKADLEALFVDLSASPTPSDPPGDVHAPGGSVRHLTRRQARGD